MAVIHWLKKVFEGKKALSKDAEICRPIDEQLVFVQSAPLSLGMEFELGLIDADTLEPAHVGPQLIAQLNSPQIKEESCQHMVEITSVIGANVQETEQQMASQIDRLVEISKTNNLLVTGTGAPPTIKMCDGRLIPDARYKRLRFERQIFNDRFVTHGMHIHIGMASADQCIRYHNFFIHFIPHLIALSASSPFENGVDTGMASMRPAITESMPISGTPYNFDSWGDFTNLCRAMFRAGSIQNMKDLWWDLRPSPRYGTMEIRICDQPATLGEGLGILAFVHLLALWFNENQDWLDEMPRPNIWRQRENKWRAMRYGLKAELVINNQGGTRPVVQEIEHWLERLQPLITKYKYERYIGMLKMMLTSGNSAERQQRLMAATQDLTKVARFNCDEFAAGQPLWNRLGEVETAHATPKAIGTRGAA